jgi:Tfp pilus assembly protein PilP
MNKTCFFIILVFTILFQLVSLTFAKEYRFRLVKPSEVRAIGFNKELIPVYDPADRINPFQPLFDYDRRVPDPKPVRTDCIPNPTLEKIDLSQLKLTGAIVTENDNLALMEEASGRGHIVHEGMCIGIHGAKVAAIKHDRIIIHEAIQNGAEEIEVKMTQIQLRRGL